MTISVAGITTLMDGLLSFPGMAEEYFEKSIGKTRVVYLEMLSVEIELYNKLITDSAFMELFRDSLHPLNRIVSIYG